METKVQSDKVREKAYQLCREYLQGRWREINQSQLILRQISGGLSNLVFYVGLPDNLEPRGREPTKIILRLFGDLGGGPAHEFKLVSETVVFTMLAERNLGPRLYGVFPGGRLEEFIPGHPLTTTELRSPEFSDQIAKIVALVHSLDVPVSKEPSWLGDTLRSLVSKLSPIVPDRVLEEERDAAIGISRINLKGEVDWLLSFLRTVHSPVVFSHNDINGGNVLAREEHIEWDPVVIIDFEFAAYNFRGFDLANHFIEWMYDNATKTFPFFEKDAKQYPTKYQRERWVRKYLETYEEQQNLQEENNQSPRHTQLHPHKPDQMEDIMDEIAAFSLASHLLWALWATKQAQTSSITFSYYHYANDRLKDYLREKEVVIELFREKKGMKRKEGVEDITTLTSKKLEIDTRYNGNHLS